MAGSLTGGLRSIVEADLFQGLTVLGLALLAFWSLRGVRTSRRVILGYGALAACAWLVALGPEIRFMGATLFAGPFSWLREFEVFRMIRVPARASVFLAFAFSILAALGLDRLRRPGVRTACLVLGLLEAAVAPLNVVAADRCIDARDKVPGIYLWLREQPGDEPVIELPIQPNDGLFLRPRFDDSVYLLRSTIHWKRMVNGYAGTEPPEYSRVREVMRDFPSEESIRLLTSLRVRHVILHLRAYGPNRRVALEGRLPAFRSRLREVVHFEDDLAFEVVPDSTSSRPPE